MSLWRAADRTIVAADPLITTRQESAYAVTVQKPEMHGPPMYYTTSSDNARASVEHLAALEPDRVITGDGPAIQGKKMRTGLHKLARELEQLTLPETGKSVDRPAERMPAGEYRRP